MSVNLIDARQTGTYTSGDVDIIATIFCDTSADLPAANYFSGFNLFQGSTAEVIADGKRYRIDSGGTWRLQPADATVALDLSGYYDSSQIDTLLAQRYPLVIVSGSAIPNNTDLDNWTQIGRFQNPNANNGCTNTPESRQNPFWIINERTYTTGRIKQTYYMAQQTNFHIFYWRCQYNSALNWTQWAKFEGVPV